MLQLTANQTTVIYGLFETDTGAIRYVGKTVQPLKQRFFYHLRDKKKCRKVSWLKSLQAKGRTAEIGIIEELSPDEDWRVAERFWICAFRLAGAALTNETDGGEGIHNPSPELRQKLRLNRLGKRQPREAVERQRLKMLGFRHTDETKRRMAKVAKLRGMPRSVIEASVRKCKGVKLRREHAEKIGAAHRGRPKSERQREILRAGREKLRSPESVAKMTATKRAQAKNEVSRLTMIANLGALAQRLVNDDQVQQVRTLRASGLSHAKIGALVDIKACTVRRICLKLGPYKD